MNDQRPKGLLMFLTFAALCGIVALVLSIQNALARGALEDAREQDRVISDLTSCARGNKLRADLDRALTGGTAYTDGTLDAVLNVAGTSPETVEAIDRALRPVRDENTALIAELTQPVDCVAVTPGAGSLAPVLIPEGARP